MRKFPIDPFYILALATVISLYVNYLAKEDRTRLHTELMGEREKFEQISKHIARIEIEYAEQAKLKNALLQKWKEVALKNEEQIKLLSDATYLIGRHVERANGPDYFFQTPKKTQNYVYNEITLAGPDSPPIGFVMIKSDGRTYKGVYPFEVRAELLQTVDEETGRTRVFAKAFYVVKDNGLAGKRWLDRKEWKDVAYPLDIVGGSTLVDPTRPAESPKKFQFWAPRLNGGANLGFGVDGSFIFPQVNVSLAGWGRSSHDLDFKFAGLGLAVDPHDFSPSFAFIPVSWRLFQPIFINTYVGPGVGVDQNGYNFFMSVGLGF